MKYILLKEENNEVYPEFCYSENIQLGEGDTLVKVAYSSLNYKDMLAFNKKSKVVAKYPIIPGIDFSGRVIASNNEQFKENQAVLGTGYDIGTKHNGGLSSRINVPCEWLIPITEDQLRQSMCYGTAGLTAGLSIYYLYQFGLEEDKSAPILVTGATGGVGSIAILILKKLGFTNIIALVHNKKKAALLRERGIEQIVYSDELTDNRPLQHQNYQFVLDTVGGDTLAQILPQVKYNGTVTTCGNANSVKLNTTMFPFILRNIRLIGVDSVYIDHGLRTKIWNKLLNEWNVSEDMITTEISIDDVIEQVKDMQEKRHAGRIIVKMSN